MNRIVQIRSYSSFLWQMKMKLTQAHRQGWPSADTMHDIDHPDCSQTCR